MELATILRALAEQGEELTGASFHALRENARNLSFSLHAPPDLFPSIGLPIDRLKRRLYELDRTYFPLSTVAPSPFPDLTAITGPYLYWNGMISLESEAHPVPAANIPPTMAHLEFLFHGADDLCAICEGATNDVARFPSVARAGVGRWTQQCESLVDRARSFAVYPKPKYRETLEISARTLRKSVLGVWGDFRRMQDTVLDQADLPEFKAALEKNHRAWLRRTGSRPDTVTI